MTDSYKELEAQWQEPKTKTLAGWRVGPYQGLVSLRTPGNDQWVIPVATARALADGLSNAADRSEGRPTDSCGNCLNTTVYREEPHDPWRCMGCSMTRKEAGDFTKEEAEKAQGRLDV